MIQKTEAKKFIELRDLEVYKISRELSRAAWQAYEGFDWQTKKVIGDQFVEAVDSVGANIAEGYGRYHYLDKIKFYYNARGSLSESCTHWLELLRERNKISEEDFENMRGLYDKLSKRLNIFISSTYRAKDS